MGLHTLYLMLQFPVLLAMLTIAPQAVSQNCRYNILQVTPHQLEYCVEDVVTLTCLQTCRCGTLSLFCEPSLFFGNSSMQPFDVDFMKVTLNNGCSYYDYSLVGLNVKTLEGHFLSCGGRNPDGTLNVSNPPLQLSVKRVEGHVANCTTPDNSSFAVEAHVANCTTQDKLNVTCTSSKVPSIVMLIVNGTIVNSTESFTGITVFSVPYTATINVSISCHVNHIGIHNSTSFTVEEQVPPCQQPMHPGHNPCDAGCIAGVSIVLIIIVVIVLRLVVGYIVIRHRHRHGGNDSGGGHSGDSDGDGFHNNGNNCDGQNNGNDGDDVQNNDGDGDVSHAGENDGDGGRNSGNNGGSGGDVSHAGENDGDGGRNSGNINDGDGDYFFPTEEESSVLSDSSDFNSLTCFAQNDKLKLSKNRSKSNRFPTRPPHPSPPPPLAQSVEMKHNPVYGGIMVHIDLPGGDRDVVANMDVRNHDTPGRKSDYVQ